MITIRFSGRAPSPQEISIGMETDSNVEKLGFVLPKIADGQIATLQMILPDGVPDALEIVQGEVTIPARIMEVQGTAQAWVEILADNVMAWHSGMITMGIGALPEISDRTEQTYPTAFQDAIVATLGNKQAAETAAQEAEIAAAIAKSAQGQVTVTINGDGDLIVSYVDTDGETHNVNLGPVSAYSVAVKYGYQGTEEEWEQNVASVGLNAAAAAESAEDAADSAEAAATAKTAAQAAQEAAETAAERDVTAWLDEHAQTAQIAVIDNTLSIEGAAAEAKVTGDELRSVKSAITYHLIYNEPKNMSHSDSDWTSGAYVDNRNGSIVASSSLSYSAKMPVNVGDVITLYDYYNGSFALRQIRSVAAYDSNNVFVSTPDSLGWKVNSYTVPSGVAYIILSANSATQYMPVANTTVSAYEAWFEPHYIATYDFIKDAVETGRIAAKNLQNGFACALPKTKFRQTVGIPCLWYKSSMATPPSIYAYVNAGYSRTTNSVETFSYNTSNANATNNGYMWYEYDPFMNLLYKFDNNTGYGAPTVVKSLNLSNCSLLAIGDSTVDHDIMTAKLLSFFTEHGHTITLLGTLGGVSDPLNKNEGRAGWTTADYMTNSTKNGYTNPFYNPSTEGFDFSYYMTQQNYSGVDFVVIQLGINDLYPTDPRRISTPDYSTIWANIRTMIDSIHEYNAATKIIINLPTTPNSNPEAHYTSEALYQNYVIKYNEFALNQILSISEDYVRPSYCHLILNPSTEIRDNVHPTDAGYEKMGLEIINQINCWQNGV